MYFDYQDPTGEMKVVVFQEEALPHSSTPSSKSYPKEDMPLEAESGLGSEWEFENWKNNPYKPNTGNLLSRCCGWCRFASALEVIHPVRLNHCQRGTMRRGRLERMGPISEEES